MGAAETSGSNSNALVKDSSTNSPDGLQPPDVSTSIAEQLQPIIDKLPAGYRIEQAGAIEESGKAMQAMLPLFPIMLAVTLLILIFQVRSISAMVMVFLTSPLGLIGVVPTLILLGASRSASMRWSA